MSRELTSLKKDAFSAIDNVKNLVGIAFIFSSVAVLIFELNTIEEMLEDLEKITTWHRKFT